MLRLQDNHELFSVLETRSRMRPRRGARLLVISNEAALAASAMVERMTFISDAGHIDAEFSVLVRSDRKGSGLGRRLSEKMIAIRVSVASISLMTSG